MRRAVSHIRERNIDLAAMSWSALGKVFTAFGAGQRERKDEVKVDLKTKRSLERSIELVRLCEMQRLLGRCVV